MADFYQGGSFDVSHILSGSKVVLAFAVLLRLVGTGHVVIGSSMLEVAEKGREGGAMG